MFGLEAGAHTALAILGARPLGRFPRAPGERLGVEVGEVREAPGGEEALADEADRALDPALLVPAGERDRPGSEAVAGRELEQRRVEADRMIDALEHGALQGCHSYVPTPLCGWHRPWA
ncbi:MAG: hypothetical protein IPF50_04415 [Proteobacteria bacterium]|nr:hypothetical protein [Pseudomonadota bacterium]